MTSRAATDIDEKATSTDTMCYQDFLDRKRQMSGFHGFAPTVMPPWLFDFQSALVDWSVRKGRAAIFADC